MKKLKVFGLSLLFVLVLFVSLVSAVRVNEVAPKTPEFVEIYNENNEILNLSEWKIKDNSTDDPDTITCNNIPDCSITTSVTYFLILGSNTDISDITNQLVTHFYVDDTKIGNYLNDGGDNVTFFNSTFSTSFSWDSSESYKSWQFYDGIWQLCSPTPGSANSCDSQNQNNNQSPPEQEPEIYLEAGWDKDEIINGEEFDIGVKAFNLKDEDYNIKIWIEFEDNETTISDRYDEENDEWKSGRYYVDNFFSGPGNKSKDIALRIRSKYREFYGDAILKIKIEDENYLLEEDIEILEKEEEEKEEDNGEQQEKQQEESTDKKAAITGNVIRLGNRSKLQEDNEEKSEGKILYESGSEKVKKYAIYALNIVLIAIIIFLLTKFKKEKR